MHYLKKIVHKTTNENAAQTAKKSKNPTRILRRVRSYKIIISRKDFVKSFNVTIFYKNLAMPYKKTFISRPGLATQTIRFGLNDISSKNWNWAWMCLFLEIFSRHWFPRPKKFSLNKCFSHSQRLRETSLRI